MAAQSDGSIVVDTNVDTRGFERGSSELRQATERLSKNMEQVGKKLQSAVSGYGKALASGNLKDIQRASEGLRQVREAAAQFQTVLAKFKGQTFSTDEYKEIQANIDAAQKALDRLLDRQAKMDATNVKQNSKAYQALQYDIEQAQIRLQDAKNDMQWYLDSVESNGEAPFSGADTAQFDAYSDKLRELEDAAGGLGSRLAFLKSTAIHTGAAIAKMAGAAVLAGLRAIGQAAAEAARNLTRMTAHAITSGIKRLGAWLSHAARSMLLFGRTAKQNNGILKKSFTTILKYGLGVRSFYYLFRKIRQAISEGYQNLARYSDTLNKSISGVISSFKRFENQFAASFAPLVNTIAPAVAQLIDNLTEATYRVGQFIAVLSGQKSVIRAKEVQEDYAASLDKTKKAAKEAERQLAGFDQLNILKKPKEDEEASPEDMFETVPVEDEAKDFADAFKEAWVNVDLSGIGEIVGGKIKVALDNIPWPDIQQGAENMGKRLATFLNGLIKVPDLGKSLGKTLAEAVNAAFSFLDGFAWSFDWRGLGNAVMDAVESACDNLDWERINHALQGLATGLADLLNTIFSRKEVWEKIGETIANGINAAVNFAIAFLEDFDFVQAAVAIVAALNKAVEKIEWDKIGRLLADALGGALRFLKTALLKFNWVELGTNFAEGLNEFVRVMLDKILGFEWAKIGTGIADGVNAAVSGIGWNSFGTLVGRLIGGALKIAASFIRGLDYEEIQKSVEEFLSSALRRIDYYDLLTVWGVAALLTALKTILAKHPVLTVLVGAVLALGPELGKVIHKMVQDIPWEEVGQTISNALIGALNRLHEAVASVNWFELGRAVGRFLGNIDWNGIVDSVIQVIIDLIKAAPDIIAGVISGMGTEGVTNALLAVAKIIGLYISGKTLLSVLLNGVETLLFNVSSALVTGISHIETAIAPAVKGVAAAALAVVDAVLLAYDVKSLKEASDTYHEAQEAHTRETETALELFKKLYEEKGPEIAAEWAKTVYQIDTTGKTLEEAQQALTEKVDSLWNDVPQNMWDGFKQGWTYYFGENGKGLTALLGDAFTGALEGIRELLGIRSPSTVMEEIGDNTVAGLFNGISAAWHMIPDFFGDVLSELNKNVSGKWNDLKTDASKAWNEVKTSVGQTISSVKQDAVSRVTEIANETKAKWSRIRTDAVSEWNNLKSSVVSSAFSVKSQVASAFQSLQGTLSGVWGSIRSAASGAMSSVSATVSSMASSISSRVSSIRSTVSNMTSSASDALSRVADKMDNLTRKTANSISVGGLASGGFVTDSGRISWWDNVRKYASGTLRAAGSLFVAGEAGPEIVGHVNGRTEVLNQSQIASAIYSAVLSAMSEAVSTFGGFLSQQMASNTNALITAMGQLQAPEPIAVSQTDAVLMERLSALSEVPCQVPAYATGTVMPYEVVAEIRRQTSEITSAIHSEGEEIIQAVVSAITNHGLSITNAIGKIPVNQGQSYSPDDITRYAVDGINRLTRMNGRSPLQS